MLDLNIYLFSIIKLNLSNHGNIGSGIKADIKLNLSNHRDIGSETKANIIFLISLASKGITCIHQCADI